MTTYSALFYHLIWSTKNREPIISETMELQLHRYIAGIIYAKKATAVQIGGMSDHIHILLRTKPDINISTLVKDLKINSTRWIKQNSASSSSSSSSNFAWQEGYGVFSVSKSNTDVVKEYIAKQKDHHSSLTFENELVSFLMKHEIQFDPKYIFV